MLFVRRNMSCRPLAQSLQPCSTERTSVVELAQNKSFLQATMANQRRNGILKTDVSVEEA